MNRNESDEIYFKYHVTQFNDITIKEQELWTDGQNRWCLAHHGMSHDKYIAKKEAKLKEKNKLLDEWSMKEFTEMVDECVGQKYELELTDGVWECTGILTDKDDHWYLLEQEGPILTEKAQVSCAMTLEMAGYEKVNFDKYNYNLALKVLLEPLIDTYVKNDGLAASEVTSIIHNWDQKRK